MKYEVVCIDASPPACGPGRLVLGQTYTVRGHDAVGALLLEGVPDDETPLFGVIGWRPDRFRPVEHKTDISALETLLNTEPSALSASHRGL